MGHAIRRGEAQSTGAPVFTTPTSGPQAGQSLLSEYQQRAGHNINTGGDRWDGDTVLVALAVANQPAVVQLVGQDATRRSITIINLSTATSPAVAISLRVCSTREKANNPNQRAGISLPANGSITINTTAEVYIANDSTTLGGVVSFFFEQD